MAIFWVICSFLVWSLPGPMMNMTGNMVHMDMGRDGWMLSSYGLVTGLVVWSLLAGIFGWLLATVYNFLTTRELNQPETELKKDGK
jgi:hypothetical protein